MLWYGAQDVLAGRDDAPGALSQFVLYAVLRARARSAQLSRGLGARSPRRPASAERLGEILAARPDDLRARRSPRRCPSRRAARSPSSDVHSPIRRGRARRRCTALTLPARARRDGGARRPVGRRQDDGACSCCCASTTRRPGACSSTASPIADVDPGGAARAHRAGAAGAGDLRRERRATTSASGARSARRGGGRRAAALRRRGRVHPRHAAGLRRR